MGSIPNNIMNFMNGKRTSANRTGETCAQLFERLNEGYGMTLRNFQERFNGKNEVRFSMRREVSAKEREIMEALYPPKKEILKRESAPSKAGNTPVANVSPGVSLKKSKKRFDWKKVWAAVKSKTPKVRTVVLLSSLVIPTLASVSNTFSVSHALSNSPSTAALITGVASATSLLFLWAGVKGIGAWFVVAATLGFEAFCNACAVFTALMGSMAYGLTTVSGKPSNFLEMVATFTGKDHQDAATWIAIFTAAMICGAQVSALYELKK